MAPAIATHLQNRAWGRVRKRIEARSTERVCGRTGIFNHRPSCGQAGIFLRPTAYFLDVFPLFQTDTFENDNPANVQRHVFMNTCMSADTALKKHFKELVSPTIS